MPANLTPQYLAAEEAFKKARTVDEKIAALKQMLALIPKHKGTEKLQADIKRRLARLREERQKKSHVARHDPFRIEREGAGQVMVIGWPNAGKSSIVAALTRAKVKIAPYPFSTHSPVAGMMPFEDIAVQLVDTPPISSESVPSGLVGALRQADGILLVVDPTDPACLEHLEFALEFLRSRKLVDVDVAENHGDTPSCLVVATRADLPEAGENAAILRESLPPGVPFVAVSAVTGRNLEELRRAIFDMLGVVRVYTKVPGRDPDLEVPFVLPRGSTVLDLAAAIHRDLPKRVKQARVWGAVRFQGQAVQRDYVLQDRDIVELHQ
ncbi:MAG: GTPase [Desulfotomaculales bacterium]